MQCPSCGFKVFNRRFPKCESCGADLPLDFRYTPAELAALEKESLKTQAERDRLKRQARRDAKRAGTFDGDQDGRSAEGGTGDGGGGAAGD